VSLPAVAAVALAGTLDTAVEELPSDVHPVALFGRVVGLVDHEWSGSVVGVVGVAAAVGLPIAAASVVWWVVSVAAAVGPLVGAVVGGLGLFATTSLRMLVRVAREVIDATADDEGEAEVPGAVLALVGRDTSSLSPGELRSAAVESAAENLADGLVAPLVAFGVGAQASLAVGVAAAAWVKAVNTLDSMLGYPDKSVGTASAILDDMVMWIPARLSAVLIAVAGGSPRGLLAARQWARVPASPNSGWPMATLAAVANVRLAKRDAYTLNPEAEFPTVAAARNAVRTVTLAGALAFLLAGVAVWP
jgi:adenosylcobinamide-phosphate synthase